MSDSRTPPQLPGDGRLAAPTQDSSMEAHRRATASAHAPPRTCQVPSPHASPTRIQPPPLPAPPPRSRSPRAVRTGEGLAALEPGSRGLGGPRSRRPSPGPAASPFPPHLTAPPPSPPTSEGHCEGRPPPLTVPHPPSSTAPPAYPRSRLQIPSPRPLPPARARTSRAAATPVRARAVRAFGGGGGAGGVGRRWGAGWGWGRRGRGRGVGCRPRTSGTRSGAR